MMGFVLWNTLGYSLQSNQKLLTANELAMLNVISNNGRVALVTEEYADFQPYLEEILKDPRVEKAILVDQARRVVASTHSSDIGNMQPDFNRTIDDDRYWRVQEMRNASGLLGVMALEFSDKAIKQIYSESRNLGVFIAAIGMLLIAVVGLAVGFVLTRRLEILTETAQRIAQGDMTTSAGIQGRDEVGILAHTMNTMAETISRRSREREALIHQLEAQNDELERYTYTVSHDLKSPVVTIKGFLGLLESDLAAGNADKVEDDLDRIGAAADKMYGLLDDLLELSRIGRVINDPVELGFNQLVDEMLLAYENNMATGEVTVNVHDNLPVVHGDRMRLMEVLQTSRIMRSNTGVQISIQSLPSVVITRRRVKYFMSKIMVLEYRKVIVKKYLACSSDCRLIPWGPASGSR